MEQWTVQHRAFVIETFLKNGDSVITTQRLFRRHFSIHRNGSIPSRNTIKLWVQNFRENGSALKRKPPGRMCTVRTPENIENVRLALLRCPHRSARAHATNLRISDRSMRRILHEDLKFHTHKVPTVKDVSDSNMCYFHQNIKSNGGTSNKIKIIEAAETLEEVIAHGTNDEETRKALDAIDALNKKACRQKYNQLRRPYFEKRNEIIKRIPNFWVTVFENHPQISTFLSEEEEDCLHYLTKLEVQEFDDMKYGYRINFNFEENPYFENNVLIKEINFGSLNNSACENMPICWKEGNDLSKNIKDETGEKGRKRLLKHKTLFSWLIDRVNTNADEISEAFKNDIWPNPLQYYLVCNSEVENDAEGKNNDSDANLVIEDKEDNGSKKNMV